MNCESEKDMAKDVEENPDLYQALADDNENAYQSIEISKSGATDENFWWSEWGHLNALKEDLAATLCLMWIGVILASISTLFINPNYSLIIVYLFLVSSTIDWWMNMKEQEKWVGENE